MTMQGIIYDELMATDQFTQGEASYYAKGIVQRLADVPMDKKRELQIRKAIWREMKQFIKVGTDIQLGELEPFIIYKSQELSKTLENIMGVIAPNKR